MVERKEALPPTQRHETIAQITYQRFFARYLRLAGISGTLNQIAASNQAKPCAQTYVDPQAIANCNAQWQALAMNKYVGQAGYDQSAHYALVHWGDVVSRDAIARRLVLYARRPGYQSQFSPLLDARIQAENPFAQLIDWVQNNLERLLDVPTLAARAGLGERNFYRRFFAATGSSPAHFVEALRLEAARTLVDGDLPLKGVAARLGLTPIRLNNAFEWRFGVAPRLFRDMHRTTGPVPND